MSRPPSRSISANEESLRIEITNGFQHYGIKDNWKLVLKNFSIKVRQGEVYVLLCPNGSGKSTVVNVILGFVRLNEGQVQILNVNPTDLNWQFTKRRIGYSPDNHILYPSLTANEILTFYGKVLELPKPYILDRIENLSELLFLSPFNVKAGNLSKSSCKCISLAIALLHEPEVLILDDTFENMDPTLAQNIWAHLHMKASKKVTVFVTSSTLAPALEADRLGIMKDGKIVFEENPSTALTHHELKDMELLYANAYSENTMINQIPTPAKKLPNKPPQSPQKMEETTSQGFSYKEPRQSNGEISKPKTRTCHCHTLLTCHNIKTLISRDIRISLRNLLYFFISLALPAIFVIIYGFTIGTEITEIPIGIVNQEISSLSCKEDNNSQYLSCKILSLLRPKKLVLNHFEDLDKALEQVSEKGLEAVIVFGEKFTKKAFASYGSDARHRKVKFTEDLLLYLDESERIVANEIIDELLLSLYKLKLQDTKEYNMKLSRYKFEIAAPLSGPEVSSHSLYLVPNGVIATIFYLGTLTVAYNIVEERNSNLYKRNFVAGITLADMILTEFLLDGLKIFVQSILMYLSVDFIIEIPMNGYFHHLTLVILIQIICGMCFGVFLASIMTVHVRVLWLVLWLYFLTILEGVFWPVESMPNWLQYLAVILPQTKAMETVRFIMLRGTTMTLLTEWWGVIIPLGWIFIFVIFAKIFNKY